jgi:spermidine synthase
MTEKTTSKGPGGKMVALVLTCFFFSGLTGLIYEILWTRMIVKIIGGAPFAVSIVLTVFMAGLGLGSYIASRTVDRIKEPARLVRIYGILELAIGAYGLLIPLLLSAFTPLYAVIYNRLFSHFMLYNILTFIGCSIILCIPVICMGATLPILCRFYVRSLSRLSTHAGRLYGLNTIGAALGALLCGFWLINYLGMPGTLILAVLINAAIGLSCLRAGQKARIQPIASDTKESPKEKGDIIEVSRVRQYPGVLAGALVIFAVSGFCAMAYEVIWARLLGLIVGPTTYSFTIVLVTFILGLALGSMIFGWLGDRVKRPIWLLLYTQIAAALLVLGISQLMGNSQLFFAKLIYHFKDSFTALHISKAAVLFAFMLLPTLCLGATFPLVGKIYTQSVSRVGRSIGVAYAINTIGAVLGSFCAGFVIIPLVGKERGLSLVIGLQVLTSLVIGLLVLARAKGGLLRWVGLAVPALAGLFLCFYFPAWNRLLLAKGKYHRFEEVGADVTSYGWLEALLRGPEILARFENAELVYYGEGIGGFTTVFRNPDPFGNIRYILANSGKADASSRGDMKTQTLLAHFPMLFHANPKTVMVLGLASGVTAGEVLYYPVDQLDVLEISRQAVEASDFFVPWNNNVLSDPRTNLIIQDARAHLQLTKQKYDVIISEPSNPWMAGLATLFTRDFFELAEKSLNENGVFCQWLHAYQMDWPTFALIGRTFVQVFPNSVLVMTEPSNIGNDYLLVGFKGSGRLVLEYTKQNLRYINRSKNITLPDARLFYRLVASEDLQTLFGPGRVNTDNRPLLEFAAPRLMYRVDPMIVKSIRAERRLMPETINIIQHVTTDVDLQIDFAAFTFSVFEPFPEMVDLSQATPAQEERFFALLDSHCANNPLDYSIFKDDHIKKRCRLVQIKALESKIDVLPDKGFSYFYLAGLYKEEGMLDETIANYYKSVQHKPDNPDAHYNLGYALTSAGRADEAIAHFKKVLRIKPNFAMAHSELAYALARLGRLEEAKKHFSESLRIDPDNAKAHSNLGGILTREGKVDEAIAEFTEALRIDPNFADGHSNLGYAMARKGRLDEAIKHYARALELKPNLADAHYNFGVALVRQGKLNEAAVHFKEALRIRPGFADARKNLERILSTQKTKGRK